jgi:hypothetical protein
MAAWEKEYEKIKKQVEESTAKKKAAVQKIIQEQTDAAASAIEAQKKAVPSEYRRLYDASEVQRIVDQRNILNRMADTGATRSGLSDTLTTAVNLSAGNRVQALNAQQQAALDKLTQALTELQAKARADIASRQADIQSDADKYLADTRGALYGAYTQAEAQKAAAAAQAKAAQLQAQATAQKQLEDRFTSYVDSYLKTNPNATPYQAYSYASAVTGYMPQNVQQRLASDWAVRYARYRAQGLSEEWAAAYANRDIYNMDIPAAVQGELDSGNASQSQGELLRRFRELDRR